MTDISTHRSKSVSGRKRSLGIIFIVFTALMGGAIAFAAWTSQGTGDSGNVGAGSATALVVTPGTAATDLTPGTSKDSLYTITNPNTYPVVVTSITVNSIAVSGGTGVPAACTSANASVTATAGTGTVSISIAAGATSASQLITLTMGDSSANGCQTALFVPNLTAATS